MTIEEALQEYKAIEEGMAEYLERARQEKFSDPDHWQKMNKRRIELINSGLIPNDMWFRGTGDRTTTVTYNTNVNGERF